MMEMRKSIVDVDGALIDIYAIEAVSAIFNSFLGEDLVMFTITLSSGETIQFNRSQDSVDELKEIRNELSLKLSRFD